ncbi:MAG: N-acetylmuramoyl-L-alanine amidase [Methylobacteriaceae bacterium]|nr:N-acetylmuramoyl-L-alanine amidase [Methylobacteriaceae bacterium]
MIHQLRPDSRIGVNAHPSPNHNERKGKPVDSIILHYTGMESADAALDLLCDPVHEVSSHYLVSADGEAFQLVPEDRRAWHAGRGTWAGETDMNARSVGIEMANAGHKYGAPPFEDAQIETVIALCKDIAARHRISPSRILGHSDIAVGRKIDPGEIFPWDRLAEAGVGHWVEPAALGTEGHSLQHDDSGSEVVALQKSLADYGYGIAVTGIYDDATAIVVTAFQRHFRPALVHGIADPSTRDTLARLIAAAPAI